MSENLVNIDDHRPAGDGGSGGNGLETRIAKLEGDVSELKTDVKSIRSDVSYIKGRLDAMPTTIQLIMFAVAVFIASGVLGYFLN